MIKLESYEVMGWEHAIRGMRNPMNSWEKSDSFECGELTSDYADTPTMIGPNDHKLMMKLRNAGTDHRKFMRMITVYVDITAPLYWWKEFDTYKVGTVANSCSTMHKIHEKEFTLDDFSCEHLMNEYLGKDAVVNMDVCDGDWTPMNILDFIKDALNHYRKLYLEATQSPSLVAMGRPKEIWWQMIQLLPSSYNQKRTIMLNYEVLANIYKSRKNHKLDEWVDFCKWIETLPYSGLITGRSLEDIPICKEIMDEAKRRVKDDTMDQFRRDVEEAIVDSIRKGEEVRMRWTRKRFRIRKKFAFIPIEENDTYHWLKFVYIKQRYRYNRWYDYCRWEYDGLTTKEKYKEWRRECREKKM